ncbi:hypothetical protein OH492_22140 [Vibrio chagasii]|nr:hypothetical protein [Vibrio chagasii]
MRKRSSTFHRNVCAKGRQDERLLALLNQLQQFGVSIQQMGRKPLDDKAQGANHQGIIAKD